MLSMPLAYPSTLDHRPPVAHIPERSTSYVEELWSPILALRPEILQAKAHANCLRLFPARSAEIFLSQAGPQLDLECFTLSITLGSDVGPIRLQYEKSDPVGSPSSGSLCR
jgi:hypothetical protein